MGIDIDEAKGDIESPANSHAISSKEDEAIHKAEETKAHIEGLKAFYTQRSKWSWFIMGTIAVLLIFHMYITICVGKGKLDYKEYEWFLPMVITENFLEIVGLAVIVVKFLFADHTPKK